MIGKIAEVDAIYPDHVSVSLYDLQAFCSEGDTVRIGSYIRVVDRDGTVLICMVENFTMCPPEQSESGIVAQTYKLEARPLGTIRDGVFTRGMASLALPIQSVEPSRQDEIRNIFEKSLPEDSKFTFSCLSSNHSITVPVDGNRFFNKHIAVVGSTGSGKSYTVASILQRVISSAGEKNNAHILIFDLHSEYRAAFPDSNYLDISNLKLPYWMMNGSELQEFFLDTSGSDHNQRNVFKEAVLESKEHFFEGSAEQKKRLTLDTPTFFDIEDVLRYAIEKNEEVVPGARGEKQGPLSGKLSNFISRLENKLNDRRLSFMMGEDAKNTTLEKVIRQLMGYGTESSNITILDVSGVPFEVLSVTVSLVSRILFNYGYFYKRLRAAAGEIIQNDVPILIVYEEAHNYVPKLTTEKYRASRESIERIAKEGRKYGVSLMLSSQRPSEISETIFSQCNSVLAMRLTNPTDQSYVKRLLPDSMGSIVDSLPSLRTGECLLVGESVVLPSIVQINGSDAPPASNDIPYWSLWQESWHDLNVDEIRDLWMER